MKWTRISYILLLTVIITNCNPKFEKHEDLIEFNVEYLELGGLREINELNQKGYYGIPRNITTKSHGDTLIIKFEVFEGGSSKVGGNIDITKDSLILKVGRETSLREYVLRQYEFKIRNPAKNEYKIGVRTYLELEEL
jgi:hypothetical protein